MFCKECRLLTKSWELLLGDSSVEDSIFHQTEPCPSIIPLPLNVNSVTFLNSIQCGIPEPQELESVGAIILPSNCMKCDEFLVLPLRSKLLYIAEKSHKKETKSEF